jgi:hypothetical protein
VLLGKEPIEAGAQGRRALEKWNASLGAEFHPHAPPPSAERLREGILLSRFLVFASGLAFEGERDDGKETLSDRGKALRTAPAEASPEAPFWFFIPFPGGKGPLLFPGCRRREREGSQDAWAIFLRLPDVGPVSVRLSPAAGGWRLLLTAEDESFARALSEGVAELAREIRAKGFPLLDATVRRMPKGQLEAEMAARMSRDTGIPLVERSA